MIGDRKSFIMDINREMNREYEAGIEVMICDFNVCSLEVRSYNPSMVSDMHDPGVMGIVSSINDNKMFVSEESFNFEDDREILVKCIETGQCIRITGYLLPFYVYFHEFYHCMQRETGLLSKKTVRDLELTADEFATKWVIYFFSK